MCVCTRLVSLFLQCLEAWCGPVNWSRSALIRLRRRISGQSPIINTPEAPQKMLPLPTPNSISGLKRRSSSRS